MKKEPRMCGVHKVLNDIWILDDIERHRVIVVDIVIEVDRDSDIMYVVSDIRADSVEEESILNPGKYSCECPAEHSVVDTSAYRPSPCELVSGSYSHGNRDGVL